MEADARGGAVRSDDAHCGATTEGMEALETYVKTNMFHF